MEDIELDNQSSKNENLESEEWPIEDTEEKNFWDKELLKVYIYPPSISPWCHIGKFNISKNNKNKILNPYIIVCNKKNAKKNNLRQYSFFFITS